jgi:phage protein D
VTLRIGREIDEFAARLSAAGQVGSSGARAWDPMRKAPLVSTSPAVRVPAMGGGNTGVRTATSAFGAATVTAGTVPLASVAEADALAQGRQLETALRYVEADAEGPGLPGLRTGTTVRIEGAGERFSGVYYVAQVTHTFGGGRYRTAFRVRRTSA